MDMTSTAEARSWYGNQRLPGSPNSSALHQNAGGSGGGVDASEMSAYYALENSNAHRRYYSAAAGYSPHSKCRPHFFLKITRVYFENISILQWIIDRVYN